MWDVAVIGGGPSGMMAAGRAAERGLNVVLLEKNPRLGEKLRITGGGRCNVTNATHDRHVLTARYGEQGKYLHSIFARFSPEHMRAFLARFELDTREEAEGRVFPVTDSAESVYLALSRYMREAGVTVRSATPVRSFETDRSKAGSDGSAGSAGPIRGVRTERGELISARCYVLAVGGASHPETGSTGDGFGWLRELGLSVRDSESSLVPIVVPDQWVHSLQGLALEDAALHVEVLSGAGSAARSMSANVHDRSAWGNAKRRLTVRGKLLFTHFGLSGPLALNAASDVQELAYEGSIRILIDLCPEEDHEMLDRKIREAADSNGKRSIGRLLSETVPRRAVSPLCELADIDPQSRLATLGKKTRRRLVELLKGMPCSFSSLMGSDKAVVSSGGLSPDEVDFRTMQLRAYPQIAVLGDLLDFNRQSGGYSLQICWASGWVAGTYCCTSSGSG